MYLILLAKSQLPKKERFLKRIDVVSYCYTFSIRLTPFWIYQLGLWPHPIQYQGRPGWGRWSTASYDICFVIGVDGRNPAPVEIGSLSHYLQGGLYIPGGAGFLPSTVTVFLRACWAPTTDSPSRLILPMVRIFTIYLQLSWNHRLSERRGKQRMKLHDIHSRGVPKWARIGFYESKGI